MAEYPALPLWTDASLGDTHHLTAEQHGAYLLLLMTAWRTKQCALPDDDARLASFARVTPKRWAQIKPIVMAFWEQGEDGLYRQGRLTDERNQLVARKEMAAKAGKASALKRKGRHSTTVQITLPFGSNGDSNAKATLPHPHPHPPCSNEQESSDATASLVDEAPAKLNGKARKPDPAGELIEGWNEMAKRAGLPIVRKITPEYRQRANQLIKSNSDDEINEALTKVELSTFCRGGGSTKWRADFKFFTTPTKFASVLEGKYDDR